MGGDEAARFVERGTRIEEDEDGGSSAAEGCAEDAFLPFQFLQRGKQRTQWGAVGLVHAVVESDGEQVVASAHEGGEQEHGILHVGDGVGTRVLGGKGVAGRFGGERVIGDGEQERPLPFRTDADDLGFGLGVGLSGGSVGVSGHASDDEATHPAGGGVVGMMFAAGGLADDLGVGPVETSEVNCEGNACETRRGGGATTFADGDIVGDFEGQGMIGRAAASRTSR